MTIDWFTGSLFHSVLSGATPSEDTMPNLLRCDQCGKERPYEDFQITMSTSPWYYLESFTRTESDTGHYPGRLYFCSRQCVVAHIQHEIDELKQYANPSKK